ncbi:MAG TPA: Mov34/MPN/PAD-1 family protein [Solirubrobacteraceae bacterium]|nr:Mov34/MPN/PAD-1 family protein [Solirubrobacteraceae bacterium]
MYERALISPATRAAIAGHVQSMANLETGGILLGRSADATTVEITRASPPGPRAVHRRFSFARDTLFLQRYLDELHDRSDGSEDYIGEWHVHPALNAPPSAVDRRALWRIAKRSNYVPTNPILLIVEDSPLEQRLRVYAFAVTPQRAWNELDVVDRASTDRDDQPR